MRQNNTLSLALLLGLLPGLILIQPPTAAAQMMRLGQYEEEAPLRTWNLFGNLTASQMAMGGTRFAHAAPQAVGLSAAQANAALLPRLPGQLTLSASGAFQRSELNAYGPVNTGVFITTGNPGVNNWALESGGIALRYRGWAVALTASISSYFDRPALYVDEEYEGQVVYAIEFAQNGFSRTYNLALSRQVNSWLAAGLGINYTSGSRERETVENIYYRNITLGDAKALDFDAVFLNGGITLDFHQDLTLGIVFRTPHTLSGDGESSVTNLTPPLTDIRIEASGESRYRQPLVLGAGAEYRPADNVRLAADATFFNWASYEVDFFDENVPRDFKNVLTLSAGAEYRAAFRIKEELFHIPLRVGISYDPQPVTSLDTAYTYVTGGLGLSHRNFFVDVGGRIGWESGSGAGLRAFQANITVGYRR